MCPGHPDNCILNGFPRVFECQKGCGVSSALWGIWGNWDFGVIFGGEGGLQKGEEYKGARRDGEKERRQKEKEEGKRLDYKSKLLLEYGNWTSDSFAT